MGKKKKINESPSLDMTQATNDSTTVDTSQAACDTPCTDTTPTSDKASVDTTQTADTSCDNAAQTTESSCEDTTVAADESSNVDTDGACNDSCSDENQENQSESKTKQFFKKVGGGFAKTGKTLWRWTKRTVMGASKDTADAFSVEAINSPGKEIVKKFFSSKLAIFALVVLFIMFFLALFGPLIWPMDVNYTQGMHKNLSPGYKFTKVPSSISKDIKDISSYSYFSVGISQDGKIAVWGNTKIPNSPTKANLKDVPEALKNNRVLFAAAGYDHAIAIAETGEVVGWGEFNNAQYGNQGSLYGANTVINMPEDLQNGRLANVNDVKQLVCGYQVTAIVMKDGTVRAWGNFSSGAGNLKELVELTNVEKVTFLQGNALALLKDGSVWFGKAAQKFASITVDGQSYDTAEYLASNPVKDIATTTAGVLVAFKNNNKFGTMGIIGNQVAAPTLAEDENIVSVGAGLSHFTVVTDKNKVYGFGNNYFGESKGFDKIEEGSKVFSGSFQNYVVNKDGKITEKQGLKGYLFGTDDMGRDVFVRIIHGGRMTMTIGAVAVIISSIIGIVIGVISGYFGGWVDILLMRVTEVFGSIPFLPFAIILSSVLAGKAITENTRIFMIMVILGLLSWTGLARMVRGQVLAEREKEFVTAAKAMGVKENRIAFKHILPNVISVIIVNMTLDFAGCMLTEASLSYLGFGVTLPKPTWGNMLDGCLSEIVMQSFWWRWFFPAIFLLLTTICINIIGDTLRDVMDPKSSSER